MKHNQKQNPPDPRALPAPATQTTILGSSMVEHVVEASRKSSRGRIILPFHKNIGVRSFLEISKIEGSLPIFLSNEIQLIKARPSQFAFLTVKYLRT